MGMFDRIFDGPSERTIFQKGKGILDLAYEANSLLAKTLNGTNMTDKIRAIEKESDNKAFSIINSVTSGAIAPNLIDDMIKYIDTEDSIVDAILNLSRTYTRYQVRQPSVHKQINGALLAQNRLTNRALRLLMEMHAAKTINEVNRMRIKVEDYEEAGDDIKDALLTFSYKSNVGYKSFYYIQDVAHLADDILDFCEDVSDIYVGIMISVLT